MDKIKLQFVNEKGDILNVEGENSPFKLEKIEGLGSADIILNSYNNASYDGIYISSKTIRGREISLSIDYMGNEIVAIRQYLIKFFNLKSRGRLIIDFGGTQRAIQYDIEKFSLPLTNIHNRINFTLDLICQSPYFEDAEEIRTEIVKWNGGGFHFPLDIPPEGLCMGYRVPQQFVNIFNEGDTKTGFKIVFKALGDTVSAPKLENPETGEFIGVVKTMQPGEEITINTIQGQKKIESTIDGNIFSEIMKGSTFLNLEMGNNLFVYSAEENQDFLEVTVYHNNQYMGV